MANESYLQIQARLALSSVKDDDIIVVWSRENGALAGVNFSDLQIGTSSDFEWVSTESYSTGEVRTYQGKWWQSLIDDNEGNIPTEGLIWTQINKVSGVIIPYWSAGLVTDHLTLFREGATIYGLRDTVTLPYNSAVTPSADLANWEIVGGGGSGGEQLNIDAGTSSRSFPTVTKIDGGTSADLI